MKLSTHFKLEELTYSRTAIENAIDNTPPPDAVHCLKLLAENLLQPLRELLGQPIFITSGYRCPELNRKVKGSATSQHITGEAADCYCTEGAGKLLTLLLTSGLTFDQAIFYPSRNILHLSWLPDGNRKEVLYK